MNWKQMRIIWVGIVIILLMGLFPPKLRATSDWLLIGGSSGSIYYTFDGYGLQFSSSGRIDIARLCVQWVIVGVITGGLIITLRDKKSRQDGSE